jgi:hypothetical protein
VAAVATADAVYIAADDRITRVQMQPPWFYTTVVDTDLVHVRDIAVDGTFLYWPTAHDATNTAAVWRLPLSSSSVGS